MTQYNTITPAQIARFWSKVDIPSLFDCWEWQASRKPDGYGRFDTHRTAHRISYLIHYGPIPPGKYVLHRCNNPACVNPAHLYLGTQFENMRDRVNAGHCDHRGEAHPKARLTEQDVLEIRRRYASGERQVDLAKKYQVKPTHIFSIVSRKAWSHI